MWQRETCHMSQELILTYSQRNNQVLYLLSFLVLPNDEKTQTFNLYRFISGLVHFHSTITWSKSTMRHTTCSLKPCHKMIHYLFVCWCSSSPVGSATHYHNSKVLRASPSTNLKSAASKNAPMAPKWTEYAKMC